MTIPSKCGNGHLNKKGECILNKHSSNIYYYDDNNIAVNNNNKNNKNKYVIKHNEIKSVTIMRKSKK
jgi:hypothetical protein